MNIHEYQAKSILADYGVPVLKGKIAYTVDEAVAALSELGGDLWVVKAQIHAGGRGKAGGVVLCRSAEDVRQAAKRLLGSTLITHQTGPNGQEVRRLYIEEGCDFSQELYLSLVVDRSHQCLSFVASAAGGMDIEEVSQKTPDKILTLQIDPAFWVSALPWPQNCLWIGINRRERKGCRSAGSKSLSQLYGLRHESY